MAAGPRASHLIAAPASPGLHGFADDVRVPSGRAISGGGSAAGATPSGSGLPDTGREPGVTDHETAMSDAPKFGRRAAPRLRLSLPAQLIAVDRVHRCILVNLSRTGAQVAILESMREGEGAILRCGPIDHLGVVTRSEFGLNALAFEEPLSDRQVLDLRHLYENFEERERRELMETARKWVTGDDQDDRAL